MPAPSSDDEDALLESLEHETDNDPSIAHLREARIQQLATELSRAKQQRNEGFGTYNQITDEKRLMEITTSVKKCIVHFYKPDFNRCRIMDGHLEALAGVHLEARVLRINVEHAPFLVTKLGVKVLPCIISFMDGVSVDRVVGFEGLGYSPDSFETGDLERRLVGAGVLERGTGVLGKDVAVRTERFRKEEKKGTDDGDDDDAEWD